MSLPSSIGPKPRRATWSGKTPVKKQRNVAESAQHAWSLCRRDHVEQCCESDRIELGEALAAKAPSCLDEHRATRHVRIGGEQLDQEQSMPGCCHELAQLRDVKYRRAPSEPEPLRDVARRVEVCS